MVMTSQSASKGLRAELFIEAMDTYLNAKKIYEEAREQYKESIHPDATYWERIALTNARDKLKEHIIATMTYADELGNDERIGNGT
jgi:hypothetical protein